MAALLWDPLKKNASVVLTAGDTIASTSQSTNRPVLGTDSKTASGVYQFEIISTVTGTQYISVGIANNTFDYTAATYLGNTVGFSYQSGSAFFNVGYNHVLMNTSLGTSDNAYVPPTTGLSVINIQIVVDLDGNQVKWYQDGVLFGTESIPAGEVWFPGVTCGGSNGTSYEIKGENFVFPIAGADPWSQTDIEVPNIVGLDQATAESTLTGAGLTVGTITTAYSATVTIGDVISQDPIATTIVPAGDPVDFVVSLGPELEMLEDFHDSTDGTKLEYNVTEGKYRDTHGLEFAEFSYVRTGKLRHYRTYNPATKTLYHYINNVLELTHTFTNALVMPGVVDYTVEGPRTIDEFSIEGTVGSPEDVATDYAFFN